jgi:very-short-patch-repair endonuclease
MARTLCDLTAVVRPWMVERAVDEALRRNLVTLRRLAHTADQLAGRGRRRCTVMSEILESRLPGYEPGESAPEKRIAELLERSGLPKPTRQHRVRIGSRTARVDLCYPKERVAIEYDSWKHHSGRRAFDADRARSNELVLLGFAVLHFTSRSGDEAIVDTVRTALVRASVG